MGQTPAKLFNPPMAFGSSPNVNNVSQAQPYQQVTGPGFAAPSGYNQAPASGQTGQDINPFAYGGAGTPQNWLQEFRNSRGTQFGRLME